MRSCSNGVYRRAQLSDRPCLLGYIGKCSAPCVGRVTPEEHRQIVDDFCAFLAGHTAADSDEVGCPEPAAVEHLMLSTRSCLAKSR